MAMFEGAATARVLEVARALALPADATLSACRWVPPAGPGVCQLCHAASPAGRTRCPACTRTSGQVSHPVHSVTPISLYRTGDDLWRLLRHYKDAWDPTERQASGAQLSWVLSQFLRLHLACIAPGAGRDWSITAVPATRRRSVRQPLELMIRRAPWLARRYVRTLRTRHAPEHNAASDRAFGVCRPVSGRQLVLLDDAFTTGASVQSAASALQAAGAMVLGVVVVGRVMNPEAAPQEAALWQAGRVQRFRLDRCCHCDARLLG